MELTEPFYDIREKGDDLLSHTVTHAVPSAQRSLTSVFGKGTGGTFSLWSPQNDSHHQDGKRNDN